MRPSGFKSGNSYISAINWDMSTKFGLLIDFDILKAAISTNAKPEIVLSGRGRHLDKAIWRPNRSNTISGFAFFDIAAIRRSKSIWANQISLTYLNWWLRYSYYRFSKTNVRHIGNLLSVSISSICPKSARYSASGYRTLSKSKHQLRKYDVIIHFSRWRPRRLNYSSGFVSVDVTAFRRSKSISKPTFVEISQMEAEIYFLWQSKMAWGEVKIFFKIKNVSISWDVLLHFVNTKMYFWCL